MAWGWAENLVLHASAEHQASVCARAIKLPPLEQEGVKLHQ